MLSVECIKSRLLRGKKVRKTAMIRKQYNQVPHLTWYITCESNTSTINITNKSHKASTFSAGDLKAEMNRRDIVRNIRHKNTNDLQKKYRLETVSKTILLESLNQFHGANLAFNSDMDYDIFGKY